MIINIYIKFKTKKQVYKKNIINFNIQILRLTI